MNEQLTSKNLPFKIGDIITAYYKGYHKVLAIHPRYFGPSEGYSEEWLKQNNIKIGDEMSPLIEYQIVLDSNGKSIKSKITKKCDASYCQLALKSLDNELNKLLAIKTKILSGELKND